MCLLQAPGGRANAKMVSKSCFNTFSLEHSSGSFFLRPDRILGCFYVNPNKLPLLTTELDWSEYENERQVERSVVGTLSRYEAMHQTNVTRIDTELDSLWQSVRNHRLKEQNKTLATDQAKLNEVTTAGRLRKSTVTGRNSSITSRVPSLVVSLENIFHHRPQASRDSSSNNNRSSAIRAAFRESQSSSSNKRGVEMSSLSSSGAAAAANQTMESNSNPLVAGGVLEDFI
jgi:hypothetical protein